METDEGNSTRGISEVLLLCDTCRDLNNLLFDIDRRLINLPSDDSGLIVLWEELGSVLSRLRDAAARLVATPAREPGDLRAKAAIFAALLRYGGAASGPVISEPQISAFALSLADEIVKLCG